MSTVISQTRRVGRPRKDPAPSEHSVLAQNIELRMTELGITSLVALSNESTVSRTVLTNIFKQPKKSITVMSGIKLASALNCRVEWLVTGNGVVSDGGRAHAPVLDLKTIDSPSLAEHIDAERKRADTVFQPSPIGLSPYCFALTVVGNFRPERCRRFDFMQSGGFVFFDCHAVPSSGSIVIVCSPDRQYRVVEFIETPVGKFTKELDDSIPNDYAFMPIWEDAVVASCVGYTSLNV
ncbi:hypothetical protein [Vibrio sp. Hal054]|uniref:hypothetical protein n=1 Tax=Vibrio sp. Hal054 TaxID=3035158 RepID=UPI00301C078F